MVKESLDEGYCDISGRVGDLDFVGDMGNVKIYFHEIPHNHNPSCPRSMMLLHDSFMSSNHSERFTGFHLRVYTSSTTKEEK